MSVYEAIRRIRSIYVNPSADGILTTAALLRLIPERYSVEVVPIVSLTQNITSPGFGPDGDMCVVNSSPSPALLSVLRAGIRSGGRLSCIIDEHNPGKWETACANLGMGISQLAICARSRGFKSTSPIRSAGDVLAEALGRRFTDRHLRLLLEAARQADSHGIRWHQYSSLCRQAMAFATYVPLRERPKWIKRIAEEDLSKHPQLITWLRKLDVGYQSAMALPLSVANPGILRMELSAATLNRRLIGQAFAERSDTVFFWSHENQCTVVVRSKNQKDAIALAGNFHQKRASLSQNVSIAVSHHRVRFFMEPPATLDEAALFAALFEVALPARQSPETSTITPGHDSARHPSAVNVDEQPIWFRSGNVALLDGHRTYDKLPALSERLETEHPGAIFLVSSLPGRGKPNLRFYILGDKKRLAQLPQLISQAQSKGVKLRVGIVEGESFPSFNPRYEWMCRLLTVLASQHA